MLSAGLWHRGRSIVLNVQDTEVGHEWVAQLPPGPEGVWWRLKAVSFNLATSAVAGNRTVRLKAMVQPSQPPGVINMDDAYAGLAQAIAAQAAAVTSRYLAAEMGVSSGFANQFMTLPHDFRMPAGHFVGSQTGALDIGDQYSAVRLYVEEWVYSPPGQFVPDAGDGSNRSDWVKLNGTLEKLNKVLEALQGATATP